MRARDNPFSAGRFDRLRYRFPAGDTIDDVLGALAHHRFRGAIVGPEGRGKTTLLDEIGQHLSDRFTLRRFMLRRGERHLPDPLVAAAIAGADHAILLDGAEQLSWVSWKGLRFRARGLGAFVITSHRTGLLPTIYECRTTPELLASLLDELAPERPSRFPSADDLFARHRGDIRQAMFEAYDCFARNHRQND